MTVKRLDRKGAPDGVATYDGGTYIEANAWFFSLGVRPPFRANSPEKNEGLKVRGSRLG